MNLCRGQIRREGRGEQEEGGRGDGLMDEPGCVKRVKPARLA